MVVPVVARAQDAKTLYDENCKKCHGVIGTPPKTMKAKYEKLPTFNAEFAAAHSADSIVKILSKGGKTEDMKSFKDKLTPEQMQLVAKYTVELANRPKAPGSP
jgi:mono/diheme cytochrome c family protein